MGAPAALGRRWAQLITAATASAHRIQDFLSVAWPTVMETCAQPLLSKTWLAAVQLVTDRCGGQPARLAALGLEEFTAVVRQAVPGWGGQRVFGPIAGRVFAVLTDTEGVVTACRRGLLRRCADELGDLRRTRAQLRTVEADMIAVLAELGLSRLGDIPALTAVGAAAILAEAGDPAATAVPRRWLSTPGCPRRRTPRAPSAARPGSPAAAGPAGG